MTGGIAGPNLGLVADFDDGEDGWGVLGMDPNTHLLDAILQLSVTSTAVATPPTTPTAGDRYIVAATATDDWLGKEGQVAVYRALPTAGWLFYPPAQGWLAHDRATDKMLRYDGTAWSRIERFTVFFFSPGKPTDSGLLLRVNLPEKLILPNSLVTPRFQVYAQAASSTDVAISVQLDGVEVATIDFTAGVNVGVWTSAGTTANAEQALTFIGPSPQDATLADLSFTLVFDYA